MKKKKPVELPLLPRKHACYECIMLTIDLCRIHGIVPVDFVRMPNECQQWEDALG